MAVTISAGSGDQRFAQLIAIVPPAKFSFDKFGSLRIFIQIVGHVRHAPCSIIGKQNKIGPLLLDVTSKRYVSDGLGKDHVGIGAT
jgi:hypothetical protein